MEHSRYIKCVTRRIFRRLLSAGISRTDAYYISKYVESQLDSKQLVGGHLFIKELCACLKAYIYRQDYEPKYWISRTKLGCPRVFTKMQGFSNYSLKQLIVVTALHKAIVYDQVTPSQREKFITSLSVDGVLDTSLEYVNHIVDQGRLVLGVIGSGDLHHNYRDPLVMSYQLHGKDKPEWTVRTVQQLAAQYHLLPPTMKLEGQKVLGNIWKMMVECHPIISDGELTSFIGNIGYTQEPGGKLRCFANPGLLFQSLLEPLKDYLSRYLYDSQTDYTHSHLKGALRVQKALADGLTVYSLDSEDATNRAPYLSQRYLLERLNVPKEYLDLMDVCVYGKWKTDLVPEGFVSWKHGQPLGLGPSFSLYALWHNCLLAGLCIKSKLPLDSFCVIGDDIAIWDKTLADQYTAVIQTVGGKVNRSKSVISNNFAEFAGFTITPTETIRPGKFSRLNALDVVNLIDTYPKIINEIDDEKLRHNVRYYLSVTTSEMAFIADLFFENRTLETYSKAGITINTWLAKQFISVNAGRTLGKAYALSDPTVLLRKCGKCVGITVPISVTGIYQYWLLCRSLILSSNIHWDCLGISNYREAVIYVRRLYDSAYIARPKTKSPKVTFFDDFVGFATNYMSSLSQ